MADNTTGDKDEKIPLITFAEARALIENVQNRNKDVS